MDSDIQNLGSVNGNGDSGGDNSSPRAACWVCGRMISSGTEVELQSQSLCGDCKFLYVETPSGQGRSRYSSSESVENMLSQQLSRMINVVRQNQSSPVPRVHENQGDVVFQQSSLPTRWRRGVVSDSESEGFYGESDGVSFSAYAAEDSDISVDGQSIMMATGMFVQSGDIDSDTDIDPMHVGMDPWNSDDNEEEDSEWEEAEGSEDAEDARGEEVQNILISSPSGSNINWRERFHSPEFEGVIRWRFREDSQTNIALPYMGNSGDYLDARGFEQFLEHLVETDVSRRGAPPASASFVKNLPCVVVKEEEHGSSCAICKDLLSVGSEVKQLPCLHLYHTCCIFPWLSSRNSCPLCRYELPTDDKDYEEHKNSGNMHEMEEQSDDDVDSSSSVASVEIDLQIGSGQEEGGGRSGRWFFLPIVSLVGIVLVLCLSGSRTSPPAFCNTPQPTHRENRNRRWWSLF